MQALQKTHRQQGQWLLPPHQDGHNGTTTYWPTEQKEKPIKTKRPSNLNQEDKTHVEQTKGNTPITHKIPLTAQVEDAE